MHLKAIVVVVVVVVVVMLVLNAAAAAAANISDKSTVGEIEYQVFMNTMQ